jgi:hypothetical protein
VENDYSVGVDVKGFGSDNLTAGSRLNPYTKIGATRVAQISQL